MLHTAYDSEVVKRTAIPLPRDKEGKRQELIREAVLVTLRPDCYRKVYQDLKREYKRG